MVLLKKPLIIGIAGGTASGKTTIASLLYEEFKQTNNICVIKEDDYYKDQSEKTYEERTLTNYDHPSAFDHDLLVSHILSLQKGEKVIAPTYDFTVHNRSDKVREVIPAQVILIEGLFVLQNPELRDLLDIKIFVDAPADVRFIRRLNRDMLERKRSMESVISQYVNTVRKMHEEYIEPSKAYADLIIPTGSDSSVAVDLLRVKINSIL